VNVVLRNEIALFYSLNASFCCERTARRFVLR